MKPMLPPNNPPPANRPSYRRSNPFRSANIRPGANSFHFVADASLESLLSKLRSQQRCAIVGRHGTGKSTLFRALVQCWRQQVGNVACYNFDAGHRAAVGSLTQALVGHAAEATPSLWAIDGFEQVPWRIRQRLLRHHQPGHLLVTTHRSSAALPLLYETSGDLDMAQRVIADILRREHLPMSPAYGPQRIKALHAKHRGNVRDMLFELYDQFQTSDRQAMERRRIP